MRNKKKGFYHIVVKAILEGSPFDTSRENDGGCKTIEELITMYILKDYSEADKCKMFNDYLSRVKGVFNHAVNYINEKVDGMHVHIFRPDGQRNNVFLSIQIDYRDAKSRNVDRVIGNANKIVKVARKEIEKTMPERLTRFASDTQKLIGDGA